jgi:hypothetical protein
MERQINRREHAMMIGRTLKLAILLSTRGIGDGAGLQP